MNYRHRTRQGDQCAEWLTRESVDGGFDLRDVPDNKRRQLHAERSDHCLYLLYVLRIEVCWVGNDGYSSDMRCNLFKKLEPFHGHCRLVKSEPGDVAAWTREACHVTAAYWIGDLRKHNWPLVRDLL